MRYNPDMGALCISGLGTPQIVLNGQRVRIRRRKALALLIYLAVEGGQRSRELLAGLFWPEYGQASASAYLRRTLWEIKDNIGDGWLDVSRERVGFLTAVDIQVDIHQFQALLQGVKDHGHPHADPCEACIEQLEEAIRLYRGDFLSGFSLRGCSAFDDWQFLQTEIHRRLFQDALQNLVNALEKYGSISDAILYTKNWLGIDNLDERAHRKLMALYARDGQEPAALRQYEKCRTVLRSELDLAPEAATTDLYNQIQERRLSSVIREIEGTQTIFARSYRTSWLNEILSSPVQVSFDTNLPAQTTRFFGRDAEIKQISELLYNPDCWLLTLTGMGGIGKTRLAVQIGQQVAPVLPDGAYFVSLEGLKAISALLPKVAETLGLSVHSQERAIEDQLTAFLSDKTLLIIFDNFDEFTSQAAILHQLHAVANRVKFLATSRERLKISGEWVINLEGLGYPKMATGYSGEIILYPAIELFIHAAQRIWKDFQANEGNYDDIAAIARLVEGIPLGLEMAASWINLLSPREILDEIQTNLDFLKTDMQDKPARQRSMRAVLDYSWERLTSDEQSSLARLSVFHGGFTRESAEKVASVTLVGLKKFMDRSLIRQSGAGRFHLHELLRQYASENLIAAPDSFRATTDRHATYYCVALSRWSDGLRGPDQIEILSAMQQEIDNIQAAWIWVTQENQIQQIQRGLEGLCYFYLRTLRNQEGRLTCQLGLASLEGAEVAPTTVLKANILAWLSIFSLNLDDHDTAAESIDTGMDIMRKIKGMSDFIDPLWTRLYMTKAIVENYLGDRQSATEYYSKAMDGFHQTQDYSGFSYLMLRALDTSGVTSEKAFRFLSEAIRYKRSSGDNFNTAYLLYIYCMVVAYHFGQPVKAANLMRESVDLFEKMGDAFSKEMALVTVDPILNTHGRYVELLEVRRKKLAYAQERGDRQTSGIYLAEIGEVLSHLGDYLAAEEQAMESLTRIKEGVAYQYAFRLCCLGEVLLAQGRHAECLEIFRESIAGMKIGEKWGQGRALAGLSIATFKTGDPEEAWKLVFQALRLHFDSKTHYFSHFSLGAYAYLLSHRGDALGAIEVYAMLSRQKFVRDSAWFRDLYCKPIYAMAVRHKPEEISSVENTGQHKDLWRTIDQVLR